MTILKNIFKRKTTKATVLTVTFAVCYCENHGYTNHLYLNFMNYI